MLSKLSVERCNRHSPQMTKCYASLGWGTIAWRGAKVSGLLGLRMPSTVERPGAAAREIAVKTLETIVVALRDAGSFDFGRLRLPSLKMTVLRRPGGPS